MKTISLAEFETLTARTDWVATQEINIIERSVRYEEGKQDEGGLFERKAVHYVWGSVFKTSALDGIEIIYNALFSYDLYDSDSLSVSQNTSLEWEVKGVIVLDEDGIEMEAHDLADYLPTDSAFSTINNDDFNIGQATDIDVSKNVSMDTIELQLDGEPNIRFTGEMVASVTSKKPFNGNGRWTELVLYITLSGKFICHQIGRTVWVNEKDRFKGAVCTTQAETIQFFGQGRLAKELYEELSIDNVTVID